MLEVKQQQTLLIQKGTNWILDQNFLEKVYNHFQLLH